MFKYSAFSFSVTESLCDTVLAYTLIVSRRAVLTYDFLTSANAIATYRWLTAMPVALGQLAFWSVVWAYAQAKTWAKDEVEACLPSPALQKFLATTAEQFSKTDADYLAEIRELILEVNTMEIDEINAHPLRKDLEEIIRVKPTQFQVVKKLSRMERANELSELNLKTDLIPLAKTLGLRTNKVRKADLVSAILDAEGYTELGAVTPATTEEE